MAPQLPDPLRDAKSVMIDIEAKLPAGAPKLSQMLPASLGRSPLVRPEEILRKPTEVIKRVEEVLELPELPKLGGGASPEAEVIAQVDTKKVETGLPIKELVRVD